MPFFPLPMHERISNVCCLTEIQFLSDVKTPLFDGSYDCRGL